MKRSTSQQKTALTTLTAGYNDDSVTSALASTVFEHDDYTYKIILREEDQRTWSEAEAICDQQEGGHLASITSAEENAFLNEKVRLISQSDKIEELWLGGTTDGGRPGEYIWLDGSPSRYMAAARRHGDDRKSRRQAFATCVMMKSVPELGIQLEVENCYTAKGYICKIEGQPKSLMNHHRFSYDFDYGRNIFKYFLLQYDMLTWSQADFYCRNVEYGHLARIDSAAQNVRVAKTLRRLRRIYGFRKMWIGASDLHKEGNFTWLDSKPFEFQNWAPGHPGRARGRGKKRDCLAVTPRGRWEDENCVQHLPFICKVQVCAQRADIAFAIDASTSVTRNGFFKAKDFIKAVIAGVNPGYKRVRVGLIRFATRATLMFPFNKHYWWYSLSRAINRMEHSQGGTMTHLALHMARTQLFTEQAGSRENVPKLLVLMTDGRSTNPQRTAREAYLLKKSGVYVLVLAIGKKVNRSELNTIASRPSDVIAASSYSDLRKIVQQTRKRLCEVNDPHEGITLTNH